MLNEKEIKAAVRMKAVWEKHADTLKRCGSPSRYTMVQRAHVEKALREFCYEMDVAEKGPQ